MDYGDKPAAAKWSHFTPPQWSLFAPPLTKRPESQLKTVISTHHTLFFNVLCNELNRANKYFLSRDGSLEGLLLHQTGDTPFFHHAATLAELYEGCESRMAVMSAAWFVEFRQRLPWLLHVD